jgi:hypothetical protein
MKERINKVTFKLKLCFKLACCSFEYKVEYSLELYKGWIVNQLQCIVTLLADVMKKEKQKCRFRLCDILWI